MVAYGLLLVTLCWLFSVTRSSVAHLYPLLADQLSLLSSLLATRLMLLLASRLSTYAAPCILLLSACYCYTSTFLPVVLAENISYTSLLLHDVFSTLLSLCYWKLATHYYLFAVCSPITAWLLVLACWTPSFSLLAPHRSPHVCPMLTTCQSLLHAGSSRLTVRFFLFSTRCWQIVVPSS